MQTQSSRKSSVARRSGRLFLIPGLLFVEFKTTEGKKVTFTDVLLGDPLDDTQAHPVYYDSLNPSDARLVTRVRWKVPVRLLLGGLCLFLPGLVLVRFRRPDKPMPTPVSP